MIIKMQKIHRRKNQEIIKEFPCTQGCGKAYGSYAALYTHVKNKHINAKPPQMKAGLAKNREGQAPKRPTAQRNNQPQVAPHNYDCNICKKAECRCEEEIDEEELDRAIAVMSDQTFIKFINFIGILHYNQKTGWIRSTEEAFDFLTRDRLREMVVAFNEKYRDYKEIQVVLSNKWLEYLSYTSRVIDKNCIIQLYNAIFLIMSKENAKDIENSFLGMAEFQTIRKCMEARQKEWQEFIEFVKAI